MISPFKVDGAYGDMTCHIAEQSLPVVVPTEPICGTTSPVTLAGNVLTHIAETLAGITLVQSVRRGAPGICGSVGSITNLKTMDHVGGAIERAMINAAVAQLAQHFELPLYSTAGTSDAKTVDIQAAYESAMSNLLVGMSGANYIHDAAGLMETDLTVSYEKLVMDNEILGMCARVLRGIEVSDETLAVDLITGKGPGKDYLAEEHTVKHMRDEFFMPAVADRTTRDGTAADGGATRNAQDLVDRIMSEEPVSRLDPDLRRRLINDFPGIHELAVAQPA
jgi:trimethylamine--corrinoid protein Co-methyltransferase